MHASKYIQLLDPGVRSPALASKRPVEPFAPLPFENIFFVPSRVHIIFLIDRIKHFCSTPQRIPPPHLWVVAWPRRLVPCRRCGGGARDTAVTWRPGAGPLAWRRWFCAGQPDSQKKSPAKAGAGRGRCAKAVACGAARRDAARTGWLPGAGGTDRARAAAFIARGSGSPPTGAAGGDVRDAEPRKRRGASERRIPRHTTTLASSSWAPMALRMRGSREENV